MRWTESKDYKEKNLQQVEKDMQNEGEIEWLEWERKKGCKFQVVKEKVWKTMLSERKERQLKEISKSERIRK